MKYCKKLSLPNFLNLTQQTHKKLHLTNFKWNQVKLFKILVTT